MNYIQGREMNPAQARKALRDLPAFLQEVRTRTPLPVAVVLDAAQQVSDSLGSDHLSLLVAQGISPPRAQAMLHSVCATLHRDALALKIQRELGDAPFAWRQIEPGWRETYRPLGVLTHIAAGNASGLPAYSVLEGLLAGNINLLKLPGADDGLSTTLLRLLIDARPQLADYIHIFDLPSLDRDAISRLLNVSDAAAVWGSELAVRGIRTLSPAHVQLIEWGHRLSLAYVTRRGESPDVLRAIAQDVCESEQLFCSSPQCVYYETEDFEELCAFAARLYQVMQAQSPLHPPAEPGLSQTAAIAQARLLADRESLLGDTRLWASAGFSVIATRDARLEPSPMYRNISVKMATPATLSGILSPARGILQTAGLACSPDEAPSLCERLLAAGICRIVPCGQMSQADGPGAPHDGQSALRRYTRRVLVRGEGRGEGDALWGSAPHPA